MAAPHIADVLKTDDLNLSLITKRMFAEGEGPSAYVTDLMAHEGLGLAKFLQRACKKFSLTLNPRNPTNRKATTEQNQSILTFFWLGLG